MKYITQFGYIITITFIAEIIKYLLALPIPAGIYGLLLMLAALKLNLFSINKVLDAGNFLTGNMLLFLIPPGVGLMVSFTLLRPILLPALITVVLSTVITMAVTAVTAQSIKQKAWRGEK